MVKIYKIHKIYWCEGGLKLANIATKNIGENDLNQKMKYIMISLDNQDRTHAQYGWYDIEQYIKQQFCMTILDLFEYSNQSVWNVWFKFNAWEYWKLSVLDGKNVVLNGKQCG